MLDHRPSSQQGHANAQRQADVQEHQQARQRGLMQGWRHQAHEGQGQAQGHQPLEAVAGHPEAVVAEGFVGVSCGAHGSVREVTWVRRTR